MAESQYLHRLHVVDIPADSITFFDGFSRHEYAWEAFARYVETPTMFMLYVEATPHVLPKRIFNSVQTARVRELLQRMIGDRESTMPLSAFPVVPVKKD